MSEDQMSEALKVFDQSGLPVKYKLTRTAMIMPDGMEFATVEKMVNGMKVVGDSVRFWLGDLLNYAERNFGEMYAQLIDASDYSYQSLKDMMWVSSSVAPSVRRDELTWSHHREVAKLTIEKQREWLSAAVEVGLNVAQLRAEINKKEKAPKTPRRRKIESYEAALNAVVSLAQGSEFLHSDMFSCKMVEGTPITSAEKVVTSMAMAASGVLTAYEG